MFVTVFPLPFAAAERCTRRVRPNAERPNPSKNQTTREKYDTNVTFSKTASRFTVCWANRECRLLVRTSWLLICNRSALERLPKESFYIPGRWLHRRQRDNAHTPCRTGTSETAPWQSQCVCRRTDGIFCMVSQDRKGLVWKTDKSKESSSLSTERR